MLTWEGSVAIQRDRLGDVLGDERVGDAGVDLVGGGLVAAEADQGELVGAHHARRHLGDPDRLAVELEAQRLGDGAGGVLGRGVAAAVLVGPAAGDGADVEDQPVAAGAQGGQQGLGDAHQADAR